MYETQWQVSTALVSSQSVAASSARAKRGCAWGIHTEEGSFLGRHARSGTPKRAGKFGSATPWMEGWAQIHSACCAALQALQQGHRRAALVTSESPAGGKTAYT